MSKIYSDSNPKRLRICALGYLLPTPQSATPGLKLIKPHPNLHQTSSADCMGLGRGVHSQRDLRRKYCKDTAQWLEGERDFSNDISKKAVGLDYGKHWRWFAGDPGYSVLIHCLQLTTLTKALALP